MAGQLAQGRRNPAAADQPHVADDRLEDDGRDPPAMRGEAASALARSLKAARACPAVASARPGCRARRGWRARTGLDQERVDVAVVAAGELDDRGRAR